MRFLRTDSSGDHVDGEGNYGFCNGTCPVQEDMDVSIYVSSRTVLVLFVLMFYLQARTVNLTVNVDINTNVADSSVDFSDEQETTQKVPT